MPHKKTRKNRVNIETKKHISLLRAKVITPDQEKFKNPLETLDKLYEILTQCQTL